jgi:hypothetical protein
VSIGFLVYFRILFGLLVLSNVIFYYAKDLVHVRFVVPLFHFSYVGFEWVRPWPGIGAHLHLIALGLLAVCLALGMFYRISSVLFALGFTHFFLIDKAYYQNHYYLLCMLSWLMVLLPAHRACSVDVLRKRSVKSSTVPAWMLWLLRFHIGVPYFYGGISKLNPDWLAGEPLRSVLASKSWYPVIGRFFTEEWCVRLFAYGGLWLDLLVVPALLWRRTRLFAFTAALFFHLMNHTLFHIGIFPWFMIFATAVFLRPDWPQRLLRMSAATAEGPLRALTWNNLCRSRKVGVLLLGGWVLFQLFWPLRHFAYAGNPSWTERGRYFAWHMLLRVKVCHVTFYLTDKSTGETGTIVPAEYLVPFQFMKMSKDPYMIQEFSRYLAGEFRKAGQDMEVRAVVLVSLNGRKPQLLIDPTVNLAAQPRAFGKPDWLMPLTEPLRNEAWNVPKEEWKNHVELPPLPFLKNRAVVPDARESKPLPKATN